VRDLLGHKTLAMTGRYVERAVDPLRYLADQVAERVAAAMGAPPEKPRTVQRRGSNRKTLNCFLGGQARTGSLPHSGTD
jgi:hypothetical protein